MNLYLKDCVNDHEENKDHANTNLKLLKQYGFTFDYKRHILSIAGLIHIKGFCTSGDPVALFDQLNAFIDYLAETPYTQKDIHDLIVNVNSLYGGDYWKCRNDIALAVVTVRDTKVFCHKKLTRITKRLYSIVEEIRLNGEKSEALSNPALLR